MADPSKQIDWEEVFICLRAFARSLMKNKGWFRGKKTTTFLKGQQLDDYIFGAIEVFLRNPEKYKPEKGSLIDYLKYGIVRRLIHNDSVSAENRTSKDVFAYDADNNEYDNSTSYVESILPHVEVFFDEGIDYNDIMTAIENEIKNDPIAENIFLGICVYGMPRRDVIKEFKMTENEFDNGLRRLNTIRIHVAEKFDIKKQ